MGSFDHFVGAGEQTKLGASSLKGTPCFLADRRTSPDEPDRGVASFLLSAHRKRPCYGASDQADGLAPSHLTHRERIVASLSTIAASIEVVRF